MTSDREPLVETDSPSEDCRAMGVESPKRAELLKPWAAKRVKMTLNQFSSFAAVAKHLNITKASAELRVSQPSLSLQLKQLEDHHGTKLYRRLSKGVEITEAGQSFLRKIMPILEQVAKLEGGFKPPPAKVAREVLCVGGTFSASAALLPRLLARFRQHHAKADLEFQTSSSEKLERMVARATMQLAVTDRKPLSRDLVYESLRPEKVLAFVLPNHPLARQQTVKLSDVLSEPLIVRGGKGISGATQNALKKLKDQGRVVRIGMLCDGPAAIKAAVRQKMGVGIAFADSIKLEIDAGEFKVLKVKDFEVGAESFIVYPKHRALSPLAQEFLELLRAARVETKKLDQPRRHAIPAKRRGENLFVTPPVGAL
jgi:DNA-binding transcriptional LysR family regulator